MEEKLEIVTDFINYYKRIPVWLMNSEGKILFSTVRKDLLRDEKEITDFFKFFTSDLKDKPVLTAVNEIELFAAFSFTKNGSNFCLIIGPVFYVHPVLTGYKHKLSFHFLYAENAVKDAIVLAHTMELDEFCMIVQVLLSMYRDKVYDKAELIASVESISLKNILNKKLVKMIFEIREEDNVSYYSYESEKKLLSIVRRGDVEAMSKGSPFRAPSIRNPLVPDTLKQFAFEVVAIITMSTRASVEGGLDVDTAFSLSDIYLEEIGKAKNREELVAIARNALRNFTQKVAEIKLKTTGDHSPYVEQAIIYIQKHLHYPITLHDVAVHIGLSEKHLSKVFILETGKKFTFYIQKERIKEACELLDNTDYSYSDIGNFLAFSSQSYFIKVFTEIIGMSPLEYRRRKKH